MKRRSFIKHVASGSLVGGAAIAAPALASTLPQVTWRLASSFPRSSGLYDGAVNMAKYIEDVTEGKFRIRVFPGGELLPALSVLDGVSDGSIECGHSASYYYYGKDPVLSFDSAVPFGLNVRQQNAWIWGAGGLEVLREVFADHNVVNFPLGTTGTQMGGWFRKEINDVDDLNGLKFRVTAFAGTVLQKLGVVPQQVAGGDIYPALERGTIDGAEWVGPFDDERQGFHRVAPYYYFPGWWEATAQVSLYVNQSEYDKLPDPYKRLIQVTSMAATEQMIATYDAENPNAMKRLISEGAKLRRLPTSVMDASYEAAEQLYSELRTDKRFDKVYQHYMSFRDLSISYMRTSEQSYDRYMAGKIDL